MSQQKIILLFFVMMTLTGCQRRDDSPILPLLTGRAVLPADTFGGGPAVGRQLEPEINGRHLPFPAVPVQGFSSLIRQTDGSFLALQDNGFGTLANSPDVPLRWYRLQLDLEGNQPHGGLVTIAATVTLSDPDSKVPFPLVQPDSARVLHGGDFDPESFVRLDDGTFWVGEEFGPALLHFDATGRLLDAPVPVIVAPALRPYGRGSYFLRSPDNPQLRFGSSTKSPDELANLPRSGGIEGLARNLDGSLLYLAVEKPLLGDPETRRRVLVEFDPHARRFTSQFWFFRADSAVNCITSLEAFSDRVFLVVERDIEEGAAAATKRIYRLDLDSAGDDGYLKKTLVCDLLKMRDNFGFSAAEEGAVGLGPSYSFPYVTPESLVIIDPLTLLICNDNNYPSSSGRRPDHTPDDTEFIRIRLPQPIKP